jgi:hypothetical protein
MPSTLAPFSTPSPPVDPVAEPPSPTWVDSSHAFVSEGLLWSVERLDHFFADEREVDLPRARSFIRWRNDLTIHDNGRMAFTTGVRAELTFPNLDRRLSALRLTISGGAADTLDALRQDGPATPDTPPRPAAGLRLPIFDTLLTQTDLQAGLLFTLPVGWFVRARLRHVQPIEGLMVARLALSGFWQTPTGFGTRQDVELERLLRPWLVLRLGNTGIVTERSRGWEWSSELSLLAAVGSRTALFLGGGPSGATLAGPTVETWTVHARIRRDVWRRWIFLELEPGVQWTRPPGGGRLRDRYVIVRLEAQFDAAGYPTRTSPPVDER